MFLKIGVLKNSQISQQNTCVGGKALFKSLRAFKERPQHSVFLWKLRNFRNTFFNITPPVAASRVSRKRLDSRLLECVTWMNKNATEQKYWNVWYDIPTKKIYIKRKKLSTTVSIKIVKSNRKGLESRTFNILHQGSFI